MRLSEQKFSDVDLNKMFKNIQGVLSNISKDNMVSVLITGVTHGTPNASKVFKHGLGKVPALVLFQEGNAYVSYGSVTETYVDVRSANAEEPFRLLLIK